MTKIQRAKDILIGLGMILVAVILALFPTKTYMVIMAFLGLSLTIYGIRMLIYYFTMARYMTGGQSILYRAVIIIDLGLFTGSMINASLLFVVIYLAGIHIFSGAIDILRALEARRFEAPSWRMKLVGGIINIILAGLCLAFLHTTWVAVEIYCMGLAYSGIMRIAQAFRRQAIVYVQ